jgi:hypothetical protein
MRRSQVITGIRRGAAAVIASLRHASFNALDGEVGSIGERNSRWSSHN